MKDNETQSPSSVLAGWKAADEDIHDGKLDPSMGAKKDADGSKPEEAKSAEVKPESEKKDGVKKDDKADLIKQDKPKVEDK